MKKRAEVAGAHSSLEEFDFIYDRDNRLVDVDKYNNSHSNFVYDGDGNRVKAIDHETGEETYYIGNYFEVTIRDEPPSPLTPFTTTLNMSSSVSSPVPCWLGWM